METSKINKEAWEARSSAYKNNIKSVLFKSFPDSLNNHIHNFHKKIILENIPQRNNLRILDLGCGYGRNAMLLLQRDHSVGITGVDISKVFVHLYKENTGQPGYIGSAENLPQDIGQFDYILCVTVLMYVEKQNMDRVIQNMLNHLKPGGSIILIEPLLSGYLFSSGFGLMRLFKNNSKNEFSNYFKSAELKNYINNNAGRILNEKRIPVTTIFIILLYLISPLFGNRVMNLICKFIRYADSLFEKLKLPSLYSALVVNKN